MTIYNQFVLLKLLEDLKGEHRQTMQGHCTTCNDPDGYPEDWPCDTYTRINNVIGD